MAKEYVPIFLDWEKVTEELNDQEKGRLIDAIVRYAAGGDWQERIKGNERYLFPAFRGQIDRNDSISKARAVAGATGGSKPKQNQAKVSKSKQTEANRSNAKQKEAKTTKEKEKEKEEEAAAAYATAATDSQTEEYRRMQDAVFEKAEQIGLPLSGETMQKLVNAVADYGEERVMYALTEASECNGVNWRYISAILKAPKQKQDQTVDDEFAGMTRYW